MGQICMILLSRKHCVTASIKRHPLTHFAMLQNLEEYCRFECVFSYSGLNSVLYSLHPVNNCIIKRDKSLGSRDY